MVPRAAQVYLLLFMGICIGIAATTSVGILAGAVLVSLFAVAVIYSWAPLSTPFLVVSSAALVGLCVIQYPFKSYVIWVVVAAAIAGMLKKLNGKTILPPVRNLLWWSAITLVVKLLLLRYSVNVYDSVEQVVKFMLLVGLATVVAQSLTSESYRRLLYGHFIIHVILVGYTFKYLGQMTLLLGWRSFGSLEGKSIIDSVTVGANTLAPGILLLTCVTCFLGWRVGGTRARMAATLLAIVSGLAIVGLASRTVWIVMGCLLGIAVLTRFTKRIDCTWGIIPGMLAGFVSFVRVLPIDVSVLRGRYALWAVGREVFTQHLFTGIGDGAWYEYLGKSTLYDSSLLNPFTGDLLRGGVHNLFLQTGVEQGVAGILLVALFFVMVKSRRRWSLVNVLLLVFALHAITEANGMFFGQYDNVMVVLSWAYLGIGMSLEGIGESGVTIREGIVDHTSVTAA